MLILNIRLIYIENRIKTRVVLFKKSAVLLKKICCYFYALTQKNSQKVQTEKAFKSPKC